MSKKERKARTPRKSRKAAKQTTDVKMLQANDRVTADQIVETAATVEKATTNSRNLSPVGKGAYYAGLAGRPSKQAVIRVFGKTGYQLSWVARAVKLGIEPDQLCERFKTDPEGLKQEWEKANTKPSN